MCFAYFMGSDWGIFERRRCETVISPRELGELFFGNDPPEFGGLVPEVRRYKKREVLLAGELFVEAQCGSDRPAFCLVDGVTEKEAFHFYNAMGLSKQHGSLATLLARINSAELALKFCHHVSECTPAKFRPTQVKGKVEDLQREP